MENYSEPSSTPDIAMTSHDIDTRNTSSVVDSVKCESCDFNSNNVHKTSDNQETTSELSHIPKGEDLYDQSNDVLIICIDV